ncbi:MAG: amidohydrolase [Gammaproteobacteria bacterium]|nr:amidohydrolase [Gammaproteobacteria bacterium]
MPWWDRFRGGFDIDLSRVKARARDAIESRRDEIVALGDRILHAPELGFKEFNTSTVVAEFLEGLGFVVKRGIAVTGLSAMLDTGRPGPTLALMGELDALLVSTHPLADPVTRAAHACGHNAQLAGLMGAAIALTDDEVSKSLSGRVAFMAVPAEEYVEVEYRNDLVGEGKLEFLAGKAEFIALGELDDVNLAMMIHSSSLPDTAGVVDSNNGCVVKLVRYIGRAAHAGGSPEMGINALSAALVAINAINALRETFRDEDSIRVHPIITRGGELVNVIPSEVTIETYVRGKTVEAIAAAERNVDRALRAGALALGAQVEIRTLPGDLPLNNSPELGRLFGKNIESIFGARSVTYGGHRAGSTDMGDVSHILPTVHPYMGGMSGTGHSADWKIEDEHLAYVVPGVAMAMTAVDLLANGAEAAIRIIDEFEPRMSRSEYLKYQRDMFRTELYSAD